jgi:hypothetical protein
VTGYHDHDGSAVGVCVIAGSVTNEGLPISGPRRVHRYGPGDSFGRHDRQRRLPGHPRANGRWVADPPAGRQPRESARYGPYRRAFPAEVLLRHLARRPGWRLIRLLGGTDGRSPRPLACRCAPRSLIARSFVLAAAGTHWRNPHGPLRRRPAAPRARGPALPGGQAAWRRREHRHHHHLVYGVQRRPQAAAGRP